MSNCKIILVFTDGSRKEYLSVAAWRADVRAVKTEKSSITKHREPNATSTTKQKGRKGRMT